MRQLAVILFFFTSFVLSHGTDGQTEPDFEWGNASYFNLNVNESVQFRNKEVKLLKSKNHFSQFKIDNDTVWLKISRRSLPQIAGGLRIFLADNKNVKALSSYPEIHGLLKKDALICLSNLTDKLLAPTSFIFPVSYNDGFIWKTEETNHMFSYLGNKARPNVNCGIDINLHDARGKEKHWILAIENCTVVWIENTGTEDKEASILFKSESNPGIYYLYEHLYDKKVEINPGDQIRRGEAIGTIWGDDDWGHLHLAVIKSDTVPSFKQRNYNVVNFFPQLYELYFEQLHSFNQVYSKGILKFGQRNSFNGGVKNTIALEAYSGKGWILGNWNIADRVESVEKSDKGNARLRKKLFQSEKAACTNPEDYYDFEINVRNGVYRIRANVGDLELPSWQKIQFENVVASTYSLDAGVFKWTSEKVVKVTDSKLTVRIFIDPTDKKVAGLSEIVFQRAY